VASFLYGGALFLPCRDHFSRPVRWRSLFFLFPSFPGLGVVFSPRPRLIISSFENSFLCTRCVFQVFSLSRSSRVPLPSAFFLLPLGTSSRSSGGRCPCFFSFASFLVAPLYWGFRDLEPPAFPSIRLWRASRRISAANRSPLRPMGACLLSCGPLRWVRDGRSRADPSFFSFPDYGPLRESS